MTTVAEALKYLLVKGPLSEFKPKIEGKEVDVNKSGFRHFETLVKAEYKDGESYRRLIDQDKNGSSLLERTYKDEDPNKNKGEDPNKRARPWAFLACRYPKELLEELSDENKETVVFTDLAEALSKASILFLPKELDDIVKSCFFPEATTPEQALEKIKKEIESREIEILKRKKEILAKIDPDADFTDENFKKAIESAIEAKKIPELDSSKLDDLEELNRLNDLIEDPELEEPSAEDRDAFNPLVGKADEAVNDAINDLNETYNDLEDKDLELEESSTSTNVTQEIEIPEDQLVSDAEAQNALKPDSDAEARDALEHLVREYVVNETNNTDTAVNQNNPYDKILLSKFNLDNIENLVLENIEDFLENNKLKPDAVSNILIGLHKPNTGLEEITAALERLFQKSPHDELKALAKEIEQRNQDALKFLATAYIANEIKATNTALEDKEPYDQIKPLPENNDHLVNLVLSENSSLHKDAVFEENGLSNLLTKLHDAEITKEKIMEELQKIFPNGSDLDIEAVAAEINNRNIAANPEEKLEIEIFNDSPQLNLSSIDILLSPGDKDEVNRLCKVIATQTHSAEEFNKVIQAANKLSNASMHTSPSPSAAPNQETTIVILIKDPPGKRRPYTELDDKMVGVAGFFHYWQKNREVKPPSPICLGGGEMDIVTLVQILDCSLAFGRNFRFGNAAGPLTINFGKGIPPVTISENADISDILSTLNITDSRANSLLEKLKQQIEDQENGNPNQAKYLNEVKNTIGALSNDDKLHSKNIKNLSDNSRDFKNYLSRSQITISPQKPFDESEKEDENQSTPKPGF